MSGEHNVDSSGIPNENRDMPYIDGNDCHTSEWYITPIFSS